MKRVSLCFLVLFLVVMGLAVNCFSEGVNWEDIARGIQDVRAVLVDPRNSRIIYMGAEKGIFKSEDSGKSWRNILSVHGQNQAVNLLAYGPSDYNSIYAACGNGLYYSSNQGKNWKRIFKGKNYLESECLSILVFPDSIYLGTKGGLFESNDKGRSWRKESGELGNNTILTVSSNPKVSQKLYLASNIGAFRKNNQNNSWENIFVNTLTADEPDLEEGNNETEEKGGSSIKYLAVSQGNPQDLYLATSRGVYKSQNNGDSWEPLSDYGLLSRQVRYLHVSGQSKIYAVTGSGIFEFGNQRWYEISLRLAAKVNSLCSDSKNNLYAACDKGLFKATIEEIKYDITTAKQVVNYLANEPNIKEVQQAAIKYAEVEPKKIIRWRKQAAKKAFLPKVSANVGRNVTDLWHWETGSSTRIDDDILAKGNDAIEWDVGLSWDLSEIIWNDAQTSIDTRSRLMVQLRDDILDEVTKLYFERIRVKSELDNLAIEERKKRFEKELRIEELTASLDALTGGYFSAHIRISKEG